MQYVASTLVSGEEILYTGKLHWIEKAQAIALSLVIIGIPRLIAVLTTEIAVTNRRLIYKTGWISRKTEEIGLGRVEEVNLLQGIGGRILGYGAVQVQGTGGGRISIPSIAEPLQFKRELQEAQVRNEAN